MSASATPGPPLLKAVYAIDVLAELLDERDPRVLDAPELLRIVLRIGSKRRLRVDDPAVDAVGRSRGAEVRVAAAILDPAEQQRRAVGEPRRAGVEDGVRRIRPVRRRQDRVVRVAVEERLVAALRRS